MEKDTIIGSLFLHKSEKSGKPYIRGTVDIDGVKVELVGFYTEGVSKSSGKEYKTFLIHKSEPKDAKEVKKEVKKSFTKTDVPF